MNRTSRWLAALCGLALFACSPTPTALSPEELEAYVAEIEQHRADRVERLKTSWLQIAGLHWLEPGDNPFGSGADNAVVLPAGAAPERAGTFAYVDGEVTMVPEPDSGIEIDGEPVGFTVLSAGAEAPRVTLGRLTFWVIERAGRHAVRLKDPQYRALTEFHGIDFYPVDPAQRVEGRLVPYDEPRSMSIETVIGHDAEMFSLGQVEFELEGEALSLEALVSAVDDESLFLIFKDGTSGGETYAAGRYLSAPLDGDVVRLDFNKAYNPPCAFTPNATCPLPPAGNVLGAAVRSGERAYHLD